MTEGTAPHALSALHARLGLTRNPFPPTPDASSYFFTDALQANFREVLHCVQARKGFVLLTGEVGLGKSTFVRRLLDTLPPEETRTALVFNTFLQGHELLAAILRDFGLQPAPNMDEALATLNLFLMEQRQLGRTCLLVIDDAQNLEPASLELIRLLCNLETGQEKLLQILLAGQPELDVMLGSVSLRQLKSRVVKHARLSGLRVNEVQRYFEMRVTAAGAEGRVGLRPSAARLLHRATGGNLRRLHLLLDRCLYGLSAQGSGMIDAALVRAAIDDIALHPVSSRLRTLLRLVLGLGGAGLVALGVGAMAGVWAPGTLPPVHVARVMPAVPVAVITPVEKIDPLPVPTAEEVQRRCLASLAAQPGTAPLLGFPISDAVFAQLHENDDLCLLQENKVHWAVWRGTLNHDTLTAGQPASPEGLQLQAALVRHGLLKRTRVDGLFGPQTSAAIGSFQAQLGLPVTAQPDPLTTLLLDRMEPLNAVSPN